MRRLVAIAIVLCMGGTGCGGCLDDESKAKPEQGRQQQIDPSRVRRQRIASPFLNLGDGGAPAAAGDGDR
jgi:hypothetical protein